MPLRTAIATWRASIVAFVGRIVVASNRSANSEASAVTSSTGMPSSAVIRRQDDVATGQRRQVADDRCLYVDFGFHSLFQQSVVTAGPDVPFVCRHNARLQSQRRLITLAAVGCKPMLGGLTSPRC